MKTLKALFLVTNIIFIVQALLYKNITLRSLREKKDVLFILIDDLRHLSSFSRNPPKTHSILDLARKGAYFKNAYSQQALCAPSRNSMLTGRRPDSLRLYDFYNYWRDSVANFTTIPQLFKEHGYHTYSVGKIFHPGKSSNFTDDYPYSWSFEPYHPSTLKYKDASVCPANDGSLQANLVCPVRVDSQPEHTLPDLQSLKRAIKILKERDPNIPLFLAVGFYKPHIPLKCPQKYLELYPLESIHLAEYSQRPYDLPLAAWHPWSDVRKRHDIRALNISFPFGLMPDLWAKIIKQSYLGCVSYIDDLLRRLLLHIDESNTIVVLTSDHGWSLGENGMWAKYSNFDVDLKVPLIFKAPEVKAIELQEPVELIDIFPTLVELAGLNITIPQCPQNSHNTLCFEGKSLVPLLRNDTHKPPNSQYVALSQYPRPGSYPARNSDKPLLKDIRIMGYSIKVNRFRYTEWIKFNSRDFVANWSHVYGKELYDHSIDANESINLYNRPGLHHIVDYCADLLRKKFKRCI